MGSSVNLILLMLTHSIIWGKHSSKKSTTQLPKKITGNSKTTQRQEPNSRKALLNSSTLWNPTSKSLLKSYMKKDSSFYSNPSPTCWTSTWNSYYTNSSTPPQNKNLLMTSSMSLSRKDIALHYKEFSIFSTLLEKGRSSSWSPPWIFLRSLSTQTSPKYKISTWLPTETDLMPWNKDFVPSLLQE